MRHISILAILSLGLSISLSAQNYFSTLTYKENRSRLISNFEFNDRHYNLGYQYFEATFENCIVISKIEVDGSVSFIKNIGTGNIGDPTVLTEGEKLYIASAIDSTVRIYEFDKFFNNLQPLVSHGLPDIDENAVLSKMISSSQYIFLFGYERKNITGAKEDAFILRVDKSDLSKINYEAIPPTMIRSKLHDAEWLNDSTIVVAALEQTDIIDFFLRLDIYDLELNKLNSRLTDIRISSNSAHDIEIVNEQIIVNQRFPYSALLSLDLEGNVNWELAIDNTFEAYESDRLSISKISIDSNKDIIVQGSANRVSDLYGFNGYIIKATNSGDLVWARQYLESVDNILLDTELKGWTETEDGYIFSGHNTYYPAVPTYNYAWILKTDFNGCISDTSCSDYQLVDTEEFSETAINAFDLLMNPVQDAIHINLKFTSNYIALIDSQGRIVYRQKDYPAGKHILDISNISSGIYFLRVDVAGEGNQIEQLVVEGNR